VALTKVRGKGLGTLGDGTASDNSIIFDGNAQDFHIGLDDSADSLTIGLGSTLGTTSHMVIDANGHITKPLQPAFLANMNSAQSLSADSLITITWSQEIYDQNADYNPSTYKFVAPVTGKYQLSMFMRVNNIDRSSDYIDLRIRTSNRTYQYVYDSDTESASDIAFASFTLSVLADMDANDEAYCTIYVNSAVSASGGTTSVDTNDSAGFSGYLVA